MTEPPIRIELNGPMPAKSTLGFCATCCLLWLGRVSMDEDIIHDTQARTEEAIAKRQTSVFIVLPHPHGLWMVREAVTIAGSVHFPIVIDRGDGQYVPTGMPPMPVCWVHLQGMAPAPSSPQAPPPGLVPGKKGQTG